MEPEPGARPVVDVTDEDMAVVYGSEQHRLVPPVAERSDEELVRLSGWQRVTSHQYGNFGYQAAAELTRRLTVELRDTREQARASADALERYTKWLVWLTVALVVLTLVLVGHAVISIVEA